MLSTCQHNRNATRFIAKSIIKIPNNIILADPEFNIPNKIDLLLDAGIFWNLLCAGQIRISRNQPVFQETQLGWIISGQTTRIKQINQHYYVSCHLSLEKQVENFWRLEDFSNKETFTTEEMKCEQHFKDTKSNMMRQDVLLQLYHYETTSKVEEIQKMKLSNDYNQWKVSS